MITLEKVLVPTDFSRPSETALMYGRELAMRFGATLHVVHVAENVYTSAFGAENYAIMAAGLQQKIEDDAQRFLHELLIDRDKSGPPTIPVILRSSSAAMAVLDSAKEHEIDIIVMGTHGRGALAHLVTGSVAERIVRLAPCPVLTVRQPEHEFVQPDALADTAEVS
jgi:nucleotide-binding universal stress UspA family protein